MEPIITFVTLVAGFITVIVGIVTIVWFIMDTRKENSKVLKEIKAGQLIMARILEKIELNTRKTLLFIFITFISFSTVFAQSGKLSGKIIDAGTNEAVLFANIVALQNGVQKGGSTSDFDGKYMITPLSPGEYDVVVSVVGYAKKTIQGVIINFETTTRLDIKITSTTEMLEEVVIYDKPLIEIDQTSTGAKLTAKEIELLPTRNINAIVNTTGGVFSSDDGEAV
ncbi:MAG: carboxypeptidase-like regulatory domain-containing protein, partial [Cytophagales bacterium]|nr:carboxypeptidase-like regulatory domain-containing protein [Cytophagales bacterium]